MDELPADPAEPLPDGALPALPRDLARLSELCREATSSVAAARGGRLLLAEEQAGEPGEEPLAQLLRDGTSCVESGWYEGALVGLAVARVRGSAPDLTGAVTMLYVEPPARGVGVGESLLAAVVDWCRGRGCRGVDVAALPGDRATKALLERCGFTARKVVMHRAIET